MAERMRQDAIIRKLEIIGEAVKQLSEEPRLRRPEIPWKQIAGMRDHLTHAYFSVDLGLVWAVVERDLDALATALRACCPMNGLYQRVVAGLAAEAVGSFLTPPCGRLSTLAACHPNPVKHSRAN